MIVNTASAVTWSRIRTAGMTIQEDTESLEKGLILRVTPHLFSV